MSAGSLQVFLRRVWEPLAGPPSERLGAPCARAGRAAARPYGRVVLLTVAAALLVSVSAFASDRAVLGGYEGWLDRMGAGVRELGRGNTGTAMQDAAPAAFWNPALLPFHRRPEFAMGGEVRSLDRNGGFLSMQWPATNNLGLGVGVVNRGDYNVRAYDSDEDFLGTARPQAFATYFGMGMRTSRRNAFGAALQVYTSTLDLGDRVGDVDFVGGVNLGWYRRYDSFSLASIVPETWGALHRWAGVFSGEFSTAVVVRNLGFNSRMTSEFDQTVTGEDVGFGFVSTGGDYFPKTVVAAVEWRKTLWERPWTFAAEVMNYQLKDALFTADPAYNRQAMRLGAEWEIAERTHFRAGLDRLNPTFGFGYAYRWSRARIIHFDYALTLERGWMTFNPYAVGVKTHF